MSPKSGPAGAKSTGRQCWQAVKDIWSVLMISVLVIGGIYTSVFTHI